MKKSGSDEVLSVKVPLTPAFKNKFIDLQQTEVELRLPLIEGEHNYSTPLIDVGELHLLGGEILQARIALTYTYYPESHSIKLCDSEHFSDDSMCLITGPKGTEEFCKQYTYKAENNPAEKHPGWNYCTPLTKGLKDAFQESIIQANNKLIEKAKQDDLTLLVRAKLPDLDPDVYENLCAVFHKNEFVEFYDSDKEYSKEHRIFHIFSVDAGWGTFGSHANFANVKGSTGDSHPGYTSFRNMWEEYFGEAELCASNNWASGEAFACNVPPRTNLFGGHVIDGTVAKSVKYGTSGVVKIIPICNAHNSNDNVYMNPMVYTAFVWLNKYHK